MFVGFTEANYSYLYQWPDLISYLADKPFAAGGSYFNTNIRGSIPFTRS